MKIVLVTCDKYSWIVNTCIKFLKRAGMPYPITVMTNTIPIDHPDVVYMGEDKGWGANLLKFLEGKEEPFILWVEVYICDTVNIPLLERAVEASSNSDVGMVRLLPTTPPDKYYNMDIGEMDKTKLSAANCHVSIWRPQALRELLRAGESAWDFEFKGAMRAANSEYKFLSTYGYAVRYSDYIIHPESYFRNEKTMGVIDPNVQAWIDSQTAQDCATSEKS